MRFLKVILLLLPLIVFIIEVKKEKSISGFSDGAIGSEEIDFYKNGTYQYRADLMLFGYSYNGKYTLKNDTIYLSAIDELAGFRTKLFVGDKFLHSYDENGNSFTEFHIEKEQ